jgi:hypothetical protein
MLQDEARFGSNERGNGGDDYQNEARPGGYEHGYGYHGDQHDDPQTPPSRITAVTGKRQPSVIANRARFVIHAVHSRVSAWRRSVSTCCISQIKH